MSWRHTPAWISLGGSLLAFNAGYVNAVGFLQVHQSGFRCAGAVDEACILGAIRVT